MEAQPVIIVYKNNMFSSKHEFAPVVVLTGSEKVEEQQLKKLHLLMHGIKKECRKLGVHFQGTLTDFSPLKDSNVCTGQ